MGLLSASVELQRAEGPAFELPTAEVGVEAAVAEALGLGMHGKHPRKRQDGTCDAAEHDLSHAMGGRRYRDLYNRLPQADRPHKHHPSPPSIRTAATRLPAIAAAHGRASIARARSHRSDARVSAPGGHPLPERKRGLRRALRASAPLSRPGSARPVSAAEAEVGDGSRRAGPFSPAATCAPIFSRRARSRSGIRAPPPFPPARA